MAEPESNLFAHARYELERIGEEPFTVEWYLSVVRAFAAFGHTGTSAAVTLSVLERLLRFEPLTELTDDPAEWIDRSHVTLQPWWQNARDGRAMSHDGGKTYWLVNERDAAGSMETTPIHQSQESASAAPRG